MKQDDLTSSSKKPGENNPYNVLDLDHRTAATIAEAPVDANFHTRAAQPNFPNFLKYLNYKIFDKNNAKAQ